MAKKSVEPEVENDNCVIIKPFEELVTTRKPVDKNIEVVVEEEKEETEETE